MKRIRTLIRKIIASTQVSDLFEESSESSLGSDHREEIIFLSIYTKIDENKEEEMMDSYD